MFCQFNKLDTYPTRTTAGIIREMNAMRISILTEDRCIILDK